MIALNQVKQMKNIRDAKIFRFLDHGDNLLLPTQAGIQKSKDLINLYFKYIPFDEDCRMNCVFTFKNQDISFIRELITDEVFSFLTENIFLLDSGFTVIDTKSQKTFPEPEVTLTLKERTELNHESDYESIKKVLLHINAPVYTERRIRSILVSGENTFRIKPYNLRFIGELFKYGIFEGIELKCPALNPELGKIILLREEENMEGFSERLTKTVGNNYLFFSFSDGQEMMDFAEKTLKDMYREFELLMPTDRCELTDCRFVFPNRENSNSSKLELKTFLENFSIPFSNRFLQQIRDTMIDFDIQSYNFDTADKMLDLIISAHKTLDRIYYFMNSINPNFPNTISYALENAMDVVAGFEKKHSLVLLIPSKRQEISQRISSLKDKASMKKFKIEHALDIIKPLIVAMGEISDLCLRNSSMIKRDLKLSELEKELYELLKNELIEMTKPAVV